MSGLQKLLIVLVGAGLIAAAYFVMTRNAPAPAPVTEQTAPAVAAANTAEIENFIRHDFPKLIVYENSVSASEHLANFAPYATESGLPRIERELAAKDWFEGAERIDMRFVAPVTSARGKSAGSDYLTRIEVDAVGGGAKKTRLYDVTLRVVPKDLNGERTYGIDAMMLTPVADGN